MAMTSCRTGLALFAAAALLAAGCSRPPQDTASEHRPAPKPTSCRQQYEEWKHGPAKSVAKAVTVAFRGVVSAVQAGDASATVAALRKAGAAAERMTANPLPRCADPHGYYAEILAHIEGASENAKSAGGLSMLTLAAASVKAVLVIEQRLSAELERTVRTYG